MKKDLLYTISCITFIIVIGGAVYEHLNIVPVWSAAPPVSLSMFRGEYGLNPELFWMIIHPINLILFTICLIIHWRTERRKNLLIVFSSYFLILVITSVYFVPELVSIINTPVATVADTDLTHRAALWETLSLVRLAALMVLAVCLLLGLTRSRESVSKKITIQSVGFVPGLQ